MMCASRGHAGVCEQLLAAGAEPDARDDADRSALHFAAMFPAADEGRPRARARASEGLRGADAARTKSRTKTRCAARQSRGAEGTRPRRCARSCAAARPSLCATARGSLREIM